jgi:hypothetical protein
LYQVRNGHGYSALTPFTAVVLNPYTQTKKMPNRPTNRQEYNENKIAIHFHLQKKGDAPAFRVLQGKFADDNAWREAATLIEDARARGDQATLVRAFTLVTWSSNDGQSEFVYAAVPCPIVRTVPSMGGHATHTTTMQIGDDCRDPIVVVPSSRLHPELTDNQILSAQFSLSWVWSVPPNRMPNIRALRKARCVYEQQRYCLTPDEGVSRRTVASQVGFFLLDYLLHLSSISVNDRFDAQTSFGFPFAYSDSREAAPIAFEEGIQGRINAIVNPEPPWAHDRTAWLPSVEKLHRAIQGTSNVRTPDELHVHMPNFFTVYKQLENEYIRRRRACWDPKYDWGVS